MTREELDEGAALEESTRVKGVVLYDGDEPPAPGESMPKIVGTRERVHHWLRQRAVSEKPWHQEMDEHLAAGGDLDTPPGGPYPFEAEVDPSSDPEKRIRNVTFFNGFPVPMPEARPRDITFVGGSYREAPRVVVPEIEPLSCEDARSALKDNLLWFLVGFVGCFVGQLLPQLFR